jgi:hypothetical protein
MFDLGFVAPSEINVAGVVVGPPVVVTLRIACYIGTIPDPLRSRCIISAGATG